MNRIFGFTVACAIALIMAGCSLSGDGKKAMMDEDTPPPPPAPARMVLVGNEPFTSTMNVAVKRYGPDNDVKLAASDEAYINSVTRKEDGGFHATYMINGKEASADFEASGNRTASEGVIFYLDNYGGTFAGKLTDYLDVNWWAYHEGTEADDNSYWGLVVYGSPTEPQHVPVEGSATYKGKLRGFSWNPALPVSGGSMAGRTRWRGNDLMLEVDFDNMTVSGNIGELFVRGPDDSSYIKLGDTNSIAITGGTITKDGISAEWTGMDTNSGSDPKLSMRGYSGDLSGGFYGTVADEIGGTMTGGRAATETTPEQIVFGAFGAKKK